MININFDYRKDCGVNGRDPDKYSMQMKKDHCKLWSRQLPVTKYGKLNLVPKKDRMIAYINGEYYDFGCDSITNCFSYRESTAGLRKKAEVTQLLDEYQTVDYVLASSIIFPLRRDDGLTRWTINQARGCLKSISDRIDLTLECIRLFYLDKEINTPLRSCLLKYSRFFEWFGNFENYVRFFFLDDLVSKDYKEVVGFTDILDFGHALPISSVEEYKSYIKRTIDFIKKRTDRISNYLNGAGSSIKSPINGGK